jgi:molecular chaperone IbpA
MEIKHAKNLYPEQYPRTTKKEDWNHTPAPKPTIETLFPNLDRWSIGFDPVFSTLKALAADKAPSYPPYNVTKNGETYMIDVALAGFSKDEIDISVVDQTLTIATASDAKIPTDAQIKKSGTEVLYQGIAKRAFKLNFALSEYVEVKQATMEDGILMVVCENQVPEALLPKKIAIK